MVLFNRFNADFGMASLLFSLLPCHTHGVPKGGNSILIHFVGLLKAGLPLKG